MTNGFGSKDNMKIWRSLERTDPAHAKPVSFGRKFTSIDAHWQIMKMTEVFGPVGKGWGYLVEHSIETFPMVATVAVADVTIWWDKHELTIHGDDGVVSSEERINSYGPIRGTCPYVECDGDGLARKSNKGMPMFDDDAAKKATTDALTKALSHLGVSADVFLGLFDDNKYVQRMQREFTATKSVEAGLPVAVSMALEQLVKATTIEELEDFVNKAREAAKDWTPVHRDLYAIRVRDRRQAIAPGIAAE